MNKISILFLAANPLGTSKLALDEEMRAIDEKIYASALRDQIALVSAWATRPDDLLQALNRYRPDIVHFSGHGTSTGELQFVGNDGFQKPVSAKALSSVFKTLKDNIRLVVLNACYSKLQAEAIRQEIECVVGMRAPIGDEAARTFAASFYRAIGFGRSVQEAFEQGQSALLLEGIDEDQTPELLVREGSDPSTIFLLRSNDSSLLDDPFHFAHDPLNYFTRLETFLSGEGHWLAEDYEQGQIYVPEKEYFTQLESVLDTKHQALLLGRAAAGKTVLAVMFAQYLQEQRGYRVGYKDVRQAEVGDGRRWYALAREHDAPKTLYVLDNCHLAPREVSEFCRQWRDFPPTHAQCLLVSRFNQQETHDEDTTYLNMFADDEKIMVRSEDIFLPVIKQYTSALQLHVPEYEDALKSDNVTLLERQHAHNLVISRSRLDAWATLGPKVHLSDIRQADLYQALERKYFSKYGNALATLSVLQRYEIRAHISFVQTLSQEEIRQLEREKLLVSSTVKGYGRLYDLVLHPTEARELFLTYVFNQYGQVNHESIQQLVVSTLETYLREKPSNYIAVYDSLARQRHEDTLKHLLLNRELQNKTAAQFSRETLGDAIRYIYKVARLDHEAAMQLMKRLVRVAGIKDICTRLVNSSYGDVTVLLQSMAFIDVALADEVVTELAVDELAGHMEVESVQDLFRLVRTLHSITPARASLLLTHIPLTALGSRTTARNFPDVVRQLQKYNYPASQLSRFITTLDMLQFARQSKHISLQSLFWSLRELQRIAPQQAQTLLLSLPTRELALKTSESNIGSVDQILQLMRRLGYPHKKITEFIQLLDMDEIGERAKEGNILRFASLLRTLKTISPVKATQLLEIVGPAEMAKVFSTQETSLSDLEQLRRASTRAYWDAFLQACSPQDISELFRRTQLGAVATFFSHQYVFRPVQEGYLRFQEKFLLQRLATEPLNRIGEFLDRVWSIPQKGQSLARHALSLFVTTEMTERIASTNILHFALLLHHARSIDASTLPALLAPFQQHTVLQQALARSDLHGIQLFMLNVSNIDERYLSLIGQSLLEMDLTEKLECASVKDIGLFLWNVYKPIDKDMARHYCAQVDMLLHTRQLQEASPEDLCFFLWNLISIRSTGEIHLLGNPYIAELLQVGWTHSIGWSFVLLGITSMAQGESNYTVSHRSVALDEGALARWFATKNEGGNPYFLALALKGIQRFNVDNASALVRRTLSLAEAFGLLIAAKPTAITAYSIQLLDEMTMWVEALLEEDGKAEVVPN